MKGTFLKRLDIAPPGGFTAMSQAGVEFHGDTFSEIERNLSNHLKANGGLPQDAGMMIELHTSERLKREGLKEWVK